MKLTMVENNVPVVVFISVWWVGAAETTCFLIMKENDKEVKIDTTDVTKEFSHTGPSPLRQTRGFKPLPEAPKYVSISQSSQPVLSTLTWTQTRGFRSTLLKFYLTKIVKDKEVDGVPMQYTWYFLHGPIPKLSGKEEKVFVFPCLNLTLTYKMSAFVWALGAVNVSSVYKTFWVNKYSGAEVSFKPDTLQDIQRKKRQEAIDKCICHTKVRIEEADKLTISVENDGRTIPLDIQFVTFKGTVKHKMSRQTDPFVNRTHIKLSKSITRRMDTGFKLVVIKRCGTTEFRTSCGKRMADVVTKSKSRVNVDGKRVEKEPNAYLHPKNIRELGETGNDYQNDINRLQSRRKRRHKRRKCVIGKKGCKNGNKLNKINKFRQNGSKGKMTNTRNKSRKKGKARKRERKKNRDRKNMRKKTRKRKNRIKHQGQCRHRTKWSRDSLLFRPND